MTLANLFDIAAFNVRMIIGPDTKKIAKSERLNYVTKFCSSSLKVATSGIVPSVVCQYRLIQTNHQRMHAAAKIFVQAVLSPIDYVK